jgi:glycerate-2-kinase
MDIKNSALTIFMEAVKAADPYRCIQNMVSANDDSIIIGQDTYHQSTFKKIFVIGGGKASARMGQALEDVLGERITGGWINTKDGHSVPLKHITVHECSHPVPDARGMYGTKKIIDILSEADEQSLVICLLSGGGSALMPAPCEGVTLEEKQQVTKLLLGTGATIGELNAIRKHLSILKGGGMARLVFPARLHVLILSDVIGDKLDIIASGPAVSDSSTFADCIEICIRRGIMEKLPSRVRERLNKGIKGMVPETAKPDDSYLSFAANTLIGNNRISVAAAEMTACSLGFNTLVLSTFLEGEASELGKFFASIASEIRISGNPIPAPACIIGGGETTVTVRGNGQGGRNQEMALSAARFLSGMDDVVFLSGGTDGTDGTTDAAGGIVDGGTVKRGKAKGLSIDDFLNNNDSYTYLRETGDIMVTGPTGTNVMDVQILCVGANK